MRRRTVLERTAALSSLGAVLTAGCLDAGSVASTDADDADGRGESETIGGDDTAERAETGLESAEWVHDVGGTVAAVVDGLVLGRENFADEDGDGGIFALEVDTGEHQWTFGESSGYSSYTAFAVDDAIYVGWGDDGVGSGSGSVHALEFDGTERWTADVGSVYHRPRLANNAVYVGSDDGVVRALETDDGTERWETDLTESGDATDPDVTVAAVEDDVYVGAGTLLALDPADGGVRWRYEDADDRIRDATVRDDVAYVTDRNGVAAVEGGERQWRTTFEHNRWIHHVAAGRVVVEQQYDLHGLDAADGDERWILEHDDRAATAVHEGTLYVAGGDEAAGGTIRAIDLDDGDERWSERVGDGAPVSSLDVVADSRGGDHTLHVETDDARLHEVRANGEVRWSTSLGGDPRSFVVDETDRVIVGAAESVYAIALE